MYLLQVLLGRTTWLVKPELRIITAILTYHEENVLKF